MSITIFLLNIIILHNKVQITFILLNLLLYLGELGFGLFLSLTVSPSSELTFPLPQFSSIAYFSFSIREPLLELWQVGIIAFLGYYVCLTPFQKQGFKHEFSRKTDVFGYTDIFPDLHPVLKHFSLYFTVEEPLIDLDFKTFPCVRE